MQTKTNVSVRSTKQDIWDAYQELLSEQTSSPTLTKKFSQTNTSLKELLIGRVNDLNQLLENTIDEMNREFDKATAVLSELNELSNHQTKELAIDKAAALETRRREEEEYRYEFDKRKKRESEELAESKHKVEQELADKKADLKLQEDELKDLRQKAAAFESEMNKAIEAAVEKTTQELTREFNHRQALEEQKEKATSQLLQQKIDSLETAIKNYQAEIVHLQTSLKESNQQLTRIAERAVEKGPSVLPQTAKE